MAHGTKLLSVLFFLTTSDKFMLVYPDDRKPKFHDTLSDNSTYFVKNAVKKTIPGIENLFEATDDTVITHSKRSFKTDQRYTFGSEWSACADLRELVQKK